MNCPSCGAPVVCGACGTAIEEAAKVREVQLEDLVNQKTPPRQSPGEVPPRTFLIVARGHGDLLDRLKNVVGDLGWVRLMEDRRDDPTILPREGRQGTVHVDRDRT